MNQTMVYKFLATHQIRDPIHKDNNLQKKEFIWGGTVSGIFVYGQAGSIVAGPW